MYSVAFDHPTTEASAPDYEDEALPFACDLKNRLAPDRKVF